MKPLGLVISTSFFLNCIFGTPASGPVAYLCNQLELFEQALVGDYPRSIPVKFGKNLMNN